jgi:hypothetical protein
MEHEDVRLQEVLLNLRHQEMDSFPATRARPAAPLRDAAALPAGVGTGWESLGRPWVSSRAVHRRPPPLAASERRHEPHRQPGLPLDGALPCHRRRPAGAGVLGERGMVPGTRAPAREQHRSAGSRSRHRIGYPGVPDGGLPSRWIRSQRNRVPWSYIRNQHDVIPGAFRINPRFPSLVL